MIGSVAACASLWPYRISPYVKFADIPTGTNDIGRRRDEETGDTEDAGEELQLETGGG